MSVFETLSGLGIMNGETALQAGKNFYGYIAMLVFKYLLNGKLTSQKKKAFLEEAHSYIMFNLGYLEAK